MYVYALFFYPSKKGADSLPDLTDIFHTLLTALQNHRKNGEWEQIRGLVHSMTKMEEDNLIRDTNIQNLIVASREMLADRINQKYKYYISLQGIPEDEVEEFSHLHTAYKALGGNHSGDAKYHYVMEHLKVIPVKVKLML